VSSESRQLVYSDRAGLNYLLVAGNGDEGLSRKLAQRSAAESTRVHPSRFRRSAHDLRTAFFRLNELVIEGNVPEDLKSTASPR
jgi:hypothetical protein